MKKSREFQLTLSRIKDFAEFICWLDTEQGFLSQLATDLPDWFVGGESVPEDYVPLETLISTKWKQLERLDEDRTRGVIQED